LEDANLLASDCLREICGVPDESSTVTSVIGPSRWISSWHFLHDAYVWQYNSRLGASALVKVPRAASRPTTRPHSARASAVK
jgi:hypothetical protein